MEDRRENDPSSWLMREPKHCVEPMKEVSQNNDDNKENLSCISRSCHLTV